MTNTCDQNFERVRQNENLGHTGAPDATEVKTLIYFTSAAFLCVLLMYRVNRLHQ